MYLKACNLDKPCIHLYPSRDPPPAQLTGICQVPLTSGSPLHTAPGDENPSRIFKLSTSEQPLKGHRKV